MSISILQMGPLNHYPDVTRVAKDPELVFAPEPGTGQTRPSLLALAIRRYLANRYVRPSMQVDCDKQQA
jgi:hypothetical protein